MILVTGGTGLVGSHLLVRLTQENEPIRAIYRTPESIEKTKNVFSYYPNISPELFNTIEWVQADITDVPSMIPTFKGVKKVYHCAAIISFDPADYRTMRKVNIHGTAIIANLCIDAKVEKLCYVSSIATIGDNPKKEVATEENEWVGNEKNNGYAITKYGAETEVWRASQEGVEVVVVNPGVILGSGFWNSGSGKLFSQVNNGFRFYTEGVTGFVSVQDVVKPMILLMNSPVKNERFILISENKSFKEIFFLIADTLGKSRPSIKIKPWQTNLFWRFAWCVSKIARKEPLLSKYSARSAHSVAEYSSEKIQKKINYQFEDLEKSVQRISKRYLK